jgi:hypothetical protein
VKLHCMKSDAFLRREDLAGQPEQLILEVDALQMTYEGMRGANGELIAFYGPTYGAWVMSVREDTLTGDFIPDEDGPTELLWSDIVITEDD